MTAGRTLKVGIMRLAHGADLPLPAYQTAEAAGLDLLAAVPEKSPIRLKPGARALVPTGLVLDLPKGTEAQVRPRSGLAFKHGVTVLNSPGTIDSDYRGEVKVLLVNLGDKIFKIERGERIAQIVVATVTRVRLQERRETRSTTRGAGGFGSTGTASGPPRGRPASAKPSLKPKNKRVKARSVAKVPKTKPNKTETQAVTKASPKRSSRSTGKKRNSERSKGNTSSKRAVTKKRATQ